MVYLYLCEACGKGNHGACEIGHPVARGTFGGSICRCPCRGRADWGTPEYNERELQKLVEGILNHQKASEEFMEKNPMEIGGPPKKLELKKEDKETKN